MRLRIFSAFLLVVGILVPSVAFGQATPATCGLASPAFCDSLSQAFPTNTRSGQLEGRVWGTSRTNLLSPGQGQVDAWAVTKLACGAQTLVVTPPNDVQICNGQMAEAMTDYGNVATLAFYPRQPFDFAGRTGKATFDVSDDTQGGHMAWPVWQITDQPIPAPHSNVNQAKDALPRNGFGFALDGVCGTGCPGPNVPVGNHPSCVTVDEMWSVSDYALTETPFTIDGCVIQPAGPGTDNHFEVDISASGVTIFGTDAGTETPLRQIAHASLTMPLTRGLVWIEDEHYNGNKEPGTQGTHTFTWANVGFDGPVLARDLGFDIPDSCMPNCAPNPTTGLANLGWTVPSGGSGQTFTWDAVTGVENAKGALLVYNYQAPYSPQSVAFSENGNPAQSYAWPYGNSAVGGMWQGAAIPLDLSQLKDGSDSITLTAPTGFVIANVDLILQGAGGVSGSAQPSPTATATSTSTVNAATTTISTNSSAATSQNTTATISTFTLVCTERDDDPSTVSCKGA